MRNITKRHYSHYHIVAVVAILFALPIALLALQLPQELRQRAASLQATDITPISGSIWLDTNQNGKFDQGESPIIAEAVYLKDTAGNTVLQTKSDSTGHYGLSGLNPGQTYTVSVDLSSYAISPGSLPAIRTVTIKDPSTQQDTENFGLILPVNPTQTPIPPTSTTVPTATATPTNTPTPSPTNTPTPAPSCSGFAQGYVYDSSLSPSWSSTVDNGIGGVTVYLYDTNGNLLSSYLTTATTVNNGLVTEHKGLYQFLNLCQGTTYKIVSVVPPDHPVQTQPISANCKMNGNYCYTFTAVLQNTQLNFGFSSSPTTKVNLTVFLHGLGNSGDNANPTDSSGSNKNPAHPIRPVTLTVFDANNDIVATAAGTITYNAANGNFTGQVDLGSAVTSGNYHITIRSDRYLGASIPGLPLLQPGNTTALLPVSLVAGDVNGDNKLDILDYNEIMSCFSEFSPAKDCIPSEQLATDITDDGLVNTNDYNLFLRELSTQYGQ